jgi:exo-1,4-beta-D-glucosaminidase
MRVSALLLLASTVSYANTSLDGPWQLASSSEIHEGGEAISRDNFNAASWIHASVPTTVMAALVQAKVFSDPDFGMNLRETPGVTYPSGYNFSAIAMPPGSPFRGSWWYRRVFHLQPNGKRHWLHLDGINFRANIWLNGRLIADSQHVAGMWRLFDFDITELLSKTADNVIAIEVFAPTPHDLANTYADWNPMPPDKNMGIWRSVWLSESGPVSIRFPQIVSRVSKSLEQATLSVSTEIANNTSSVLKVKLRRAIGASVVDQEWTLTPNEKKVISFKPFIVDHPRRWWPINMGEPFLQTLKLEAVVNGEISDASETAFGIREVTSELVDQDPTIPAGKDGIPKKNLLFRINGQKILIRGAGYTFDMLLRSNPERQEAELDYVRDMHLNAIRFEGKIEDEHFLKLADQKGILIMAGWSCCDHWEEWKKWNEEDYVIASASLRDQIHRLRAHPSVFVWLNGSDNPPPPEQEERYINILKELNWPNPYISSATSRVSKVSSESGVKMLGPYDYVSPSYWLTAHSLGGAYGFNTETSPGPAVPPVESLKTFLPPDHLWPIDSWWSYHSGGGKFRTLDVFNEAMNKRYGQALALNDYDERAQLMAYEGERAMFEAFGRNKYVATGVIQWMLNNAWPSMIWHLYDYFLRPGGGYFGAKKACEPLHIQYSYDDSSVVIVNSYRQDFPGLAAKAQVFNMDLREMFSKSVQADSRADSSQKLFVIPSLDGLSETYFVRLELTKDNGLVVSRNFYWLARQPDVLDLPKSNWYLTPTKTFGSLQSLNSLPKTDVVVRLTKPSGSEDTAEVTIKNIGQTLAFDVELRLLSNDEEILPVLWDDNYFVLMPGETRTLMAHVHAIDLKNKNLTVRLKGWNVDSKSETLAY